MARVTPGQVNTKEQDSMPACSWMQPEQCDDQALIVLTMLSVLQPHCTEV